MAVALPEAVGDADATPAQQNSVDDDHQRVGSKMSLAGPPPEDPGAAVASRKARLLVFIFLCQGVQMFMSYDGGAVPASLDTLQDIFHNSWTELEIGILGSMDKVGMVAASVPWGYALQRCNAKLLLTLSLLINAAVTFVFGWLPNKALMLLAKFIMGATQSLQGVWGTVWTVNLAPPDQKTMWLGLGAVSAGVGNGIGTAVAGLGTANGLPFSFAFQLAGGVLGALWLLQLFFPLSWLRTEIPGVQTDHGDKSESERAMRYAESPHSEPEASVWEQLRSLMQNRIFVGTTLAISLNMFQVSGIQYLWTRVFTEIWMVSATEQLSKSWVTVMFLVVTGVGGGLGIAVGPWIIDRSGGFQQPTGILRTLKILMFYQVLAAIAGLGGVAALYGKFHEWHYCSPWGDVWLWLTWLCIFVIYAAQNASVAALCGINLQVIPQSMRTFASGTEIAVRNVLGYMGGPLFPSIVMQLNSGWSGGQSWQLSLGLGFVCLMNVVGVLVLAWLRLEARLELANKRARAQEELRSAIQSEDVQRLEQAVANARHVELEKTENGHGEAVMGMANELIGRCHAQEASLAQAAHAGGGDSIAEQQELIDSLRQEILQQQEEIQKLRAELAATTQEVSAARGAEGATAARDVSEAQNSHDDEGDHFVSAV